MQIYRHEPPAAIPDLFTYHKLNLSPQKSCDCGSEHKDITHSARHHH